MKEIYMVQTVEYLMRTGRLDDAQKIASEWSRKETKERLLYFIKKC